MQRDGLRRPFVQNRSRPISCCCDGKQTHCSSDRNRDCEGGCGENGGIIPSIQLQFWRVYIGSIYGPATFHINLNRSQKIELYIYLFLFIYIYFF